MTITSVIAHIDHGKTTLIDSLISSQGYISKSLAGDVRYLDSRADEQQRGITLKLSPIRLKNEMVFIDTPGHVDFESLIFCASILSDSCLIVVDVNEGITPRTFSLLRHINRSRSVLVLNKIDKCENQNTVEIVLHQLNGILEDDVFEWEKNNVILASSTLCTGICYKRFSFGKKNTLQNAFKAFKLLESKVSKNDVSEIVKKYNIMYPTKKAVFSTVMPLSDTIIACVSEYAQSEKMEINEKEFFIDNDYYTIQGPQTEMLGITVYGMLICKQRGYVRDNIAFLTKIVKGRIEKGCTVLNSCGTVTNQVVVEKVYEFAMDGLKEVESAVGPCLVCLCGDFMKNSAISSQPVEFVLKEYQAPVYVCKILLDDLLQLKTVKETIKCIGLTEQSFKAKITKFSEIEFKCAGQVQFEKVCHNLQEAGYKFSIRQEDKNFTECPTKPDGLHYCIEGVEFVIKIGPLPTENVVEYLESICIDKVTHEFYNEVADFDDLTVGDTNVENKDSIDEKPAVSVNRREIPAVVLNGKNGNVFVIKSTHNAHVIESVLDVFVNHGPLIREKVINAAIYIEFIQEDTQDVYNILKGALGMLYLRCAPVICPMFHSVTVFIEKMYLGAVYVSLQMHRYQLDEEKFNDETGFVSLNVRIPQFLFKSFVDDVKLRTKGTAYFEQAEYGYVDCEDFSEFVNQIRHEKGMPDFEPCAD